MKIVLLLIEKRPFVKRILIFTAILIYIALIYAFSNQQGAESNKLSGSIVDKARQHIELPEMIKHNKQINKLDYNYILRKTTHFLEYFALALLLHLAFTSCKVGFKKSLILTFILCICLAYLDEYHQYFVQGRTSKFRDVFIDSAGALTGTISIYCIKRYITRKKANRNRYKV